MNREDCPFNRIHKDASPCWNCNLTVREDIRHQCPYLALQNELEACRARVGTGYEINRLSAENARLQGDLVAIQRRYDWLRIEGSQPEMMEKEIKRLQIKIMCLQQRLDRIVSVDVFDDYIDSDGKVPGVRDSQKGVGVDRIRKEDGMTSEQLRAENQELREQLELKDKILLHVKKIRACDMLDLRREFGEARKLSDDLTFTLAKMMGRLALKAETISLYEGMDPNNYHSKENTMTLDNDKIKAGLEEYFGAEGLSEKLAKLKDLNLNPFSLDDDGTPEGWDDLKQARVIITELIHFGILAVEKLSADAAQVESKTPTGKEKLDALVEFLDDCIKLPWYAEIADGPILRMIISSTVGELNILFGKDWASKVPGVRKDS